MTTILNVPVTTAVAAQVGTTFQYRDVLDRTLYLQGRFIYGSGGTSADAWVQTSVDGGTTWSDIANFHFTTASARFLFNLSSLSPVTAQSTPGDGVLAANTAVDGLIGPKLRVKYTTVGTYAGGTQLIVDASTTRLFTP